MSFESMVRVALVSEAIQLANEAKEAAISEVMRLADEYRAASDVLWRDGWDRPSESTRAALEAAVRKLAGLTAQSPADQTPADSAAAARTE